MKSYLFKRRNIAAAVIILLLQACNSSSNEPLSTTDPEVVSESISDIGISDRLITALTENEAETWACIASESGIVMGYTFLAPGAVEGFDRISLGLEEVPTDSGDHELFKFIWRPASSDTVLLDNPKTGEQVSWTTVSFSGDKLLRAYSSVRGQLYCSRETRPRG